MVDYVWYIKIMNLKVYSQLFVAIEVMGRCIVGITMDVWTAFVFSNTFFHAVPCRLSPQAEIFLRDSDFLTPTVPKATLD